jgi:hypothetical protein
MPILHLAFDPATNLSDFKKEAQKLREALGLEWASAL